MKTKLLFYFLFIFGYFNSQTNVYSYGFDVAFSGWTIVNQSEFATTTLWGKAAWTAAPTSSIFGSGTAAIPSGQAGGTNSFAFVNYTSTSSGTISNWLITPSVNVKDGDIVSFYSRKGTDGTIDYPDRLELRYSTAATMVVPSTGFADVGSFTNLGVTVNPTLAGGFVYPKVWTKYSFTISGVGSTPIPANFAFRYFVDDGGSNGANSDIIGIDTFSVDRPALAVSDVNYLYNLISLYPNPTTDFLTIKTDKKINGISIYDISGKKVNVMTKDNTVNVENLENGVYLITIETTEGKTTQKFIKK